MNANQLNIPHTHLAHLLRRFSIVLFSLMALTGSGFSQTNIIDSIYYDGVWRNYRLHLPPAFTPQSDLPVIINMHGLGSNALEQEVYSGMDCVADTADFAVCYPNGLNESWNVIGDTIDDIGFIDSLIGHLHVNYNFNLQRVYATGMSNGAFMTYLLACELTHRFAAVAGVAGTNTVPNQAFCNASKKIPVLHIHGTDDVLVPYGGSFGIVPVDNHLAFWATHNGCDLVTDTVKIPNTNSFDQSTAERIDWLNCDGNTEVILYRVINGGHTWPGAPVLIGVTNQDFSASEVIWQFFNQSLVKPTGTQEIDQRGPIRIHPNPAGDFITINGSGKMASGNLFDLNGKQLLSFPTSSLPLNIDLQQIPPGVYVVRLDVDGTAFKGRIVKH